MYGVATKHPAFKTFLPTLFSIPIVSQVMALIYPMFDSNLDGLAPLKAGDARALGGLVLTVLFGLRVYNVHWSGATPASAGSAEKKKTGAGKKGVTTKAQ